MDTLKEDVNKKLSHIFHDIKELQRTVIHLREGQRKAEDTKVSNWLRPLLIIYLLISPN